MLPRRQGPGASRRARLRSVALPFPAMVRLLPLVLALLGTAALASQAAIPLSVTGLPPTAPLTITAQHDGRVLEVTVDLQAGWHVYTADAEGGLPLTVEITAGAFEAAAPLVPPPATHGEVTGKATFKLPLRRVGDGAQLAAQVEFMVCDALQCLPPMTLQLATAKDAMLAVPALRVLLVGVDDGERTQRIATFLRTRGFATSVATYANVSQAACDGADVVLADSPTFRNVKGQTGNARRFPTTATPIVAVGFLGTELIEAQGVAMTSGYI